MGEMAALTGTEAVERARRLVPVLRERAAKTAALRRLPDETFADLVASGLARDVVVPGHRTLRLADVLAATTPGREVNGGPLYKLPLVGSWQVFRTAPATGIARAAMDAWIERGLGLSDGLRFP